MRIESAWAHWAESAKLCSERKCDAVQVSGAVPTPLPLLLELGDSGSSECPCENRLYPLLSEPGLNGVVLSRGKVGLGGSVLIPGSSGDGASSMLEDSSKLC